MSEKSYDQENITFFLDTNTCIHYFLTVKFDLFDLKQIYKICFHLLNRVSLYLISPNHEFEESSYSIYQIIFIMANVLT